MTDTWMRTSNFMTACSKDRIKLIPLFFLATAFLFTACKKSDPNTIGADFIGARDGFNVHVTDTPTLVLFSAKHDSFATKVLTYYMLGDLNDPVFGRTKSNIYAQFSLPSNNEFSFGSGAVIDSVVLRLKPVFPGAYYGSISDPQHIAVYELKEQLSASVDSGYFWNRSYSISENGSRVRPAPIGYFSGVMNLTDSFRETVSSINYTLEPHVRIRLSNAFSNKLLRALASGAFQSQDAFKNYINGLAILAEMPEGQQLPGQGAIVNFNLRSSVSAVVVYYTNSSGSSKAEFPFSATDIKTNQYSHKTNLPLQPYLGRTHFNETYVQSTGGIKTRILMPYLLELAKTNAVAIVGAELVFTVQDGYENDPMYPVPQNLLLVGADEQGRNAFLLDQFETTPVNYYGGTYDASTHQYKFNIIRQLQFILNTYRTTGENVNYGLNLLIPADDNTYGVGAGRLVLNTNTALKKVKLNLSYTVIK